MGPQTQLNQIKKNQVYKHGISEKQVKKHSKRQWEKNILVWEDFRLFLVLNRTKWIDFTTDGNVQRIRQQSSLVLE